MSNYFDLIERYIYIENTSKSNYISSFNISDKQKDILNKLETEKYLCIKKSRQVGVTTIICIHIAIKMIESYLLNNRESIIMIVPNGSVGKIYTHKILRNIKYLMYLYPDINITANSKYLIKLNNGSFCKIILNDTCLHGISPTRIFIDEAAYKKDIKILYKQVLGTLDHFHNITVYSTPNGKNNFFHDIYDDPLYYNIDYVWYHDPRFYEIKPKYGINGNYEHLLNKEHFKVCSKWFSSNFSICTEYEIRQNVLAEFI